MVVLLFIVRLIELLVSELPSHPVNSYPSLGVAVTETVCPDSYSPPVVDTVPPSPAVTLKVYFTTGAGVTGLLMGVGSGMLTESALSELQEIKKDTINMVM